MKQTLKITISPTKPKGIAYKIKQKKMPHPPSHMEKEGGACRGLKTTIKKRYCNHKFDKKKPHPSFPLKRMGGVIIIISEIQWLCHLHQYVHEVQHPHLHFFAPAMEQHELHFLGLLSSR